MTVRAHAVSVAPVDAARSTALSSPAALESALVEYSHRLGTPFSGVRWSVTFHRDSSDYQSLVIDLLDRRVHTEAVSIDVVQGSDETSPAGSGHVVIVVNGLVSVDLGSLLDMTRDVVTACDTTSSTPLVAIARVLRPGDSHESTTSAIGIATDARPDTTVVSFDTDALDRIRQSSGQVSVGDVLARMAATSWRDWSRPDLEASTAVDGAYVDGVEIVQFSMPDSLRRGASSPALIPFGPHSARRDAAVHLTVSPAAGAMVVYVQVHAAAGTTARAFAGEMSRAFDDLVRLADRSFTRLDDRGLRAKGRMVGHVA